MQVESPASIRNVALAGHNDTGKTTLASALLFAAGVTPRFGRVEDKTAPTDFDPEEQERGISIGLATARLPWREHVVELLDTPGYGIFFSETKAAMRVSDGVLICVSGVAGVEVNTEKVFEYAAEIELPKMAGGVVPLTIAVEDGFYPRELDPSSTDPRFLGMWVEVKR